MKNTATILLFAISIASPALQAQNQSKTNRSEPAVNIAVPNTSPDFAAARQAAESGDALAQFRLAQMYSRGVGGAPDPVQAIDWYRASANQGYAPAQYFLATALNSGIGVRRDQAEALVWYRKAANQGHAAAWNSIGFIYENGFGVAKSDVEAANAYRKAADLGNATAQNNLAIFFRLGKGVKEDYLQSLSYLLKAAEQGFPGAWNDVGIAYANGLGVGRNDVEAVKAFRKGAELGNAPAQYNLGLFLSSGRGVRRDEVAAMEWYDKSAKQSYADAWYQIWTYHVGKDKDYNQLKAQEAMSEAVRLGSELMKMHLKNEQDDRQVIAMRQALALSSSPKGTILNCTTEGVVRVNAPLNTVSFACPSLGDVKLQALHKNKWKLDSSERIPAVDGRSLTRDDIDNDWNGIGVIISIVIEKQ